MTDDEGARSTRAQFVRGQSFLVPVALVPEIAIYQAEEPIGLWEMTEGEYHSEQPPPFWAFAWAGGQALTRFVLDHPEHVAGRRVLDLASGSGLVAVAAARAGAADVRASDIDPLAVAAIEVNAAANGVPVRALLADLLDDDPARLSVDVITAGDVFYSRDMAARVERFLRRAARAGILVLVGDPGRAYFPAPGIFTQLAEYDVPVTRALESRTSMRTRVHRLAFT